MTAPSPDIDDRRRRVAAVVGLTLLDVLRRQDLPSEVLEAENTSITMPRRLGLSEVIDRQIRAYREDVRRGRRHTDREFHDLVQLVIRRPDSEEVFYRSGRLLATKGEEEGDELGWRRILPEGIAFGLARRRARRRFRAIFGRTVGAFAAGPFVLEGRQHLLIKVDPGGDACAFATGLCESIVRRYAGEECTVVHSSCQSRRDDVCRWTLLAEERVEEREAVRDLRFTPEPETS